MLAYYYLISQSSYFYSTSASITFDPTLGFDECTLPKKLALELFKPLIYLQLFAQKYKNKIREINTAENFSIKEPKTIEETLLSLSSKFNVIISPSTIKQRFNLLAFKPLLTNDEVIKVSPLVKKVFCDDFFDYKVKVYLPLSPSAQKETQELMLPSKNLRNPANGDFLFPLEKDLLLGCCYLTKSFSLENLSFDRYFSRVEDVLLALDAKVVKIHTPIGFYYKGELIDLDQNYRAKSFLDIPIKKVNKIIKTTVGRVIFNSLLPNKTPFINGLIKKDNVREFLEICLLKVETKEFLLLLESLKNASLEYITKYGLSLGINDFAPPKNKKGIINSAKKELIQIDQDYENGEITTGGRFNNIYSLWFQTSETINQKMFIMFRKNEAENKQLNPLMLIADSGASSLSTKELNSLISIRGVVAFSSIGLFEMPIINSLSEGLEALEYFMSTLKASEEILNKRVLKIKAQDFTHRLILKVKEVAIFELDCQTQEGFIKKTLFESGEVIRPLSEQIIGRILQENIIDPINGQIIAKIGEEVTEETLKVIQDKPIRQIKIRSPLTCKANKGVCAKCYGRDLSTNKQVQIGIAIGLIAAQAIGARSDEFVERIYFMCACGCSRVRFFAESSYKAYEDGIIHFSGVETVLDRDKKQIVVNQGGYLILKDEKNNVIDEFPSHYGAQILVNDGAKVKENETFIIWDAFNLPIVAKKSGKVQLQDLVLGLNLKEEINDITGLASYILTESDNTKLNPKLLIKSDEKVVDEFVLSVHTRLLVKDGEEVKAGDKIATFFEPKSRVRDLRGGLASVEELVEMRCSSDTAILARFDGQVKFSKRTVKSKRRTISIIGNNGQAQKTTIPRGVHVYVQEGDYVKAGDPLIDGAYDPIDLLKIFGVSYLQNYLLDELQLCYKVNENKININDKHFEVLIRQILSFVKTVF